MQEMPFVGTEVASTETRRHRGGEGFLFNKQFAGPTDNLVLTSAGGKIEV